MWLFLHPPPSEVVETAIQSTSNTTVTKFCKHCGQKIPANAVVCTSCGCQVEELQSSTGGQPNIIINNTNSNQVLAGMPQPKDKWVALLLCFFLGWLGAHKFYEGKTLLGVLYIFTCGGLIIGMVIDFFSLLFKPNPYYV